MHTLATVCTAFFISLLLADQCDQEMPPALLIGSYLIAQFCWALVLLLSAFKKEAK